MSQTSGEACGTRAPARENTCLVAKPFMGYKTTLSDSELSPLDKYVFETIFTLFTHPTRKQTWGALQSGCSRGNSLTYANVHPIFPLQKRKRPERLSIKNIIKNNEHQQRNRQTDNNTAAKTNHWTKQTNSNPMLFT